MDTLRDSKENSKDADDPEEKRQRLRTAVLKEIFDSETKYLQDLYTLIIYYITPIKTNNRFPEISANPKADVKMLFSTVELIFDGNSELVELFKAEFSTSSKDPMVGKIFVQMVDKLCQYYGVFCNHQKEAMDTIDRCMKTSPAFKGFVDQCMQKPETNGLSLLDYLVKPFQRLLKYPLLLKELIKLTPETHPDHKNLQQAMDKIQAEVDKINKDKAKSDNMRKMLEVNQSTEGFPKGFKLLLPTRQFVFEGTLRKISGKNDQERYIFLFNDCLIYCKKKTATEYICRGVIFLTKLQLDDIPDSLSFKVTRHDKNLVYVFYGKTQKEKDTWMHEIRNQQSKIGQLSWSKSRSTLTTMRKDVVRIYTSDKKFKTFAISGSTSVAEIAEDLLKKLKREGLETPIAFKLCLIVNAAIERDLEADEKVLKIFTDYSDKGIKLETETCCIAAHESTVPYESHDYSDSGELTVGSPK